MDTGFDSLESTLLVNRLTKELGLKVPADLLNDAPTVGEMVDLLKDMRGDIATPLLAAARNQKQATDVIV